MHVAKTVLSYMYNKNHIVLLMQKVSNIKSLNEKSSKLLLKQYQKTLKNQPRAKSINFTFNRTWLCEEKWSDVEIKVFL